MPGEIAEMMLNGFLDCETGEFIDGEEPGWPRTVAEAFADGWPNAKAPRDTKCPNCKRKFRGTEGLKMHQKQTAQVAKGICKGHG